MKQVVVGVRGTLSANGAKDIDLLVHSHNVGNPSPCHVIEDRAHRGMIGGSICSLDQIFDIEVAKHEGFAVTERGYYMAMVSSEFGEEPSATAGV